MIELKKVEKRTAEMFIADVKMYYNDELDCYFAKWDLAHNKPLVDLPDVYCVMKSGKGKSSFSFVTEQEMNDPEWLNLELKEQFRRAFDI